MPWKPKDATRHNLLREEAVTRNPFAGIPAPKSGRRLPKALSVEQAVRLTGIEGGDVLAQRDRAIVELSIPPGCGWPSWSRSMSATSTCARPASR